MPQKLIWPDSVQLTIVTSLQTGKEVPLQRKLLHCLRVSIRHKRGQQMLLEPEREIANKKQSKCY